MGCLSKLLLVALMTNSACVRVQPTVIDRRTQLENQMIGLFRQHNRQLILHSSVRGASKEAKETAPQGYDMLVRRAFNEDDIVRFKNEQLIGEGRDGVLHIQRGEMADDDPFRAQLVKQTVAEENEDRVKLMKVVLQMQSTPLNGGSLDLMKRILAGIQRRAAQRGHLVQTEGGKWVSIP